jgi:hypothetical protein
MRADESRSTKEHGVESSRKHEAESRHTKQTKQTEKTEEREKTEKIEQQREKREDQPKRRRFVSTKRRADMQ